MCKHATWLAQTYTENNDFIYEAMKNVWNQLTVWLQETLQKLELETDFYIQTLEFLQRSENYLIGGDGNRHRINNPLHAARRLYSKVMELVRDNDSHELTLF